MWLRPTGSRLARGSKSETLPHHVKARHFRFRGNGGPPWPNDSRRLRDFVDRLERALPFQGFSGWRLTLPQHARLWCIIGIASVDFWPAGSRTMSTRRLYASQVAFFRLFIHFRGFCDLAIEFSTCCVSSWRSLPSLRISILSSAMPAKPSNPSRALLAFRLVPGCISQNHARRHILRPLTCSVDRTARCS